MEPTIRREQSGDMPEIHKIITLAFGRENEAKLVDLLRNSKAFIPQLSLIATTDGKPVGHILFSKISIVGKDHSETGSLALAPMAVLPQYQRKGIGSQLIQTGLEKAKELKYKSVIVLGHDTYYPRFGFTPANNWDIKPPFDVPPNAFMAIELVSGGLKGISGTVQYPKEFESV